MKKSVIEIPSTGIGDLSDGYHTFNDLYHHRAILFAKDWSREMNIGSIKKEHSIVTEMKTATFSKNDLEKIILSHLMWRGYNIDGAKIFFDAEWKYVTDDCGMNRRIVTTFKGATVELPGE